MIFLRAFGLTRFAESQRTRRSSASCAHRRRSTRFPQAKVKVSGIRDNCHCPAWRLLIGVCAIAMHVFIHAPVRACKAKRRERTRSRVDARNTVPHGRTSSWQPYGACKDARRVTSARTVCLLARRRLRKRARTSCRSGSKPVRRSTTAGVQGISPACEDFWILGATQSGSQSIR
jgi:hypothetical protein